MVYLLTIERYSGDGYTLTKNVIYGVPQRALIVTGRPSVQLPSRTKLHPGGPYFYLINGAGTVPLKNESASTILTMAANSITTVLLGTTQWWAFNRPKNTVVASGHSTRGSTVGDTITGATVTVPTDYDPITCSGGWRRARYCSGGGKVSIYMLDSEVSPHFTAGVAVFKYLNICYYFKESDPKTVAHGYSIADTDVTWFVDCDSCTGSGGGGGGGGTQPCNPDDPLLPSTIVVQVGDPDSDPTSQIFYRGGIHTFRRSVGSTTYEWTPPDFSGCCIANMQVYCTPTGWEFSTLANCVSCPGGDAGQTASQVHTGGVSLHGPYIGTYPYASATVGGTFGGPGAKWPGLSVEVLGYGEA